MRMALHEPRPFRDLRQSQRLLGRRQGFQNAKTFGETVIHMPTGPQVDHFGAIVR